MKIIILTMLCSLAIGADATAPATATVYTLTDHTETRAGLGGDSPFEKFYPTTLNYGITIYCADTNLCYFFRQKPDADGTWTLDWVKAGKP